MRDFGVGKQHDRKAERNIILVVVHQFIQPDAPMLGLFGGTPFAFFGAEYQKVAVAQIKHKAVREGGDEPVAQSSQVGVQTARAVNQFARFVVMRRNHNALECGALVKKLGANHQKRVFVKELDVVVAVQVGILRVEINNQNHENAEIAGNQCVVELFANHNAEEQQRVIGQKTDFETVGNLFPAECHAEK